MSILRANQLDPSRACVLCVDIQEKLLPHIRGNEAIVSASRTLLAGAALFELPVLATEQYPKGIGATVPAVREALQAARATVLEKMAFSSFAERVVRDALLAIDRPQVIVFGIESHVCVQQTTLDLVSRDYDVFVCADAVGSRGATDHERALERMRQEGAFVTTVESVLFELCHRCDAPRFKRLIEIIKAAGPRN